MKNFLENGDHVVVTAPGAVASGDFVVVGSLYGVAMGTSAINDPVVLSREGVFKLPKLAGTAWVQGDKLYWDAGAANFTKVAAGNKAIGVAFAAAASADTTGQVSLDEVPEGGDLINPLVGVGAGYKVARGVHQQAAAVDTVATGLATVVAVVATWQDGPTLKQMYLGATIGDQAGAPAAGSIQISSWKPTAVNDVTPIAASDFSENKKVNWTAFGT